MPPIGGLEAAANLAKIKGEYYGKIYPQWAEVYNRFNKGKGRSVGTRGYELATEKTPVSTYAFTTDGGAQPGDPGCPRAASGSRRPREDESVGCAGR